MRTDIEVGGRCQVRFRAVEAGISLPGDGRELGDLELAGRQRAVQQFNSACVGTAVVREQLQLVGEHGSVGVTGEALHTRDASAGGRRASLQPHAGLEPACTLLSCPTARAHGSIVRGVGQVNCAAARGGYRLCTGEVLCDLNRVLLRARIGRDKPRWRFLGVRHQMALLCTTYGWRAKHHTEPVTAPVNQ